MDVKDALNADINTEEDAMDTYEKIARARLQARGVPLYQGYHKLTSEQQTAVLDAAKAHRYRNGHTDVVAYDDGYLEGFADGCLVGKEEPECVDGYPALRVGQIVEYADLIKHLGFNTNVVGPLLKIDFAAKDYPYMSIRMWWQYVRRLSDGMVFGPYGKIADKKGNVR